MSKTYMLLYFKKKNRHLCLLREFNDSENIYSALKDYNHLYAANAYTKKKEANEQMNWFNDDMQKRGKLLDYNELSKIKRGLPQAIYTGGGIYICGMNIDENQYYTICSDYLGCISLFDRRGEDNPTDYDDFPAQNMLWSKSEEEFSDTEKAAYTILKNELRDYMGEEDWLALAYE